MNKYKVTIVTTNVYDCEVEANSLLEAKELALAEPDTWVLDTYAGSTECGYDHHIWRNDSWEEISHE